MQPSTWGCIAHIASDGGWFRLFGVGIDGVIVAVVPAEVCPNGRFGRKGNTPDVLVPEGFRLDSDGLARDHESYLVQVDGKGKNLYWPRVKQLALECLTKEA